MIHRYTWINHQITDDWGQNEPSVVFPKYLKNAMTLLNKTFTVPKLKIDTLKKILTFS